MNRRRLIVVLAAGAALVAGVVSLRGTSGVSPLPGPPPPPEVAGFTASGVHVEPLAGPPATPGMPRFAVGEDTPVLRWAPVPAATGYEVAWRPVSSDEAERDERRRLTAVPAVALTGVPARSSVSVAVTAIDAAGRRSAPLRLSTGSLTQDSVRSGDAGPAEFADPFVSAAAPDRYRWRLPEGNLSCLVRGGGADLGMLVVQHACGTVQLRPAVPLQLSDGPDGARGRISLAADGPVEGGELAVALLPGPHAGLPPGILDRPGPQAGTAGPDPALPAGAVLLRIGPHGPALSLAGPATATTGPAPLAVAEEPAVPHTWELRITPGAITVLRDGARTLTAAVALPWREATAVVAVRPGPDGVDRTLVDGVRMSSAPPPPDPVQVVAVTPGGDIPAAMLSTASGLRLLGWLQEPPARGADTVAFRGGPPTGLQPVGAPSTDGTLAVTADLPVPTTGPGDATLTLTGPPLKDAVLEVTHRPMPATEAAAPRLPLSSPPAAPVAQPRLRVRAQQGDAPVAVEIGLDPRPAQRRYGAPGGYVGLEVFLGERRIAGVSTATAGPAVGGRYVLTLDRKLITPGVKLRVRVVPADRDVLAGTAAVTLVPS